MASTARIAKNPLAGYAAVTRSAARYFHEGRNRRYAKIHFKNEDQLKTLRGPLFSKESGSEGSSKREHEKVNSRMSYVILGVRM
jgi:hypothetical protein